MGKIKPSVLPAEPQSIEEAGLSESLITSLVLKTLYFRGEVYGRDLSIALGLKFSVIQEVIEALKIQHLVQVKRSLGVGTIGSLLVLTDAGRDRAREALDACQYAGAAPVPLDQYLSLVRLQRPGKGWLTRAALARALSSMVITEQLLSQVGPAVSSSNSMLLYGKPGDGKTFLIESLNNLDTAPVFVPQAIECQGNIIQVFDPVYHSRLEEENESPAAIVSEAPYDRRWVMCKRPFIVSGGELTLDMLDLRYNSTSKIYEAPFQLKANNGIYLIDDFGRQRATPAEVLNRWIVPMERRVDYLSFMSGGKMTVPFDTFLVFSTNLKPSDLGDEAFLRRIHYKMLLRGPAKSEFVRIFQNVCGANRLPCQTAVLDNFIAKYYEQTGKAFRRCHPRDVITHALNLIHFENLPTELTANVLERAFESCFVQDEEAPPADAIKLVETEAPPCADYWRDRTTGIPTAFGMLVGLSAFRDRASGLYHDDEAARDYPAADTSATLAAMHSQTFRRWLEMSLEQKREDLEEYLSTPEGRAAFLGIDKRELVGILLPGDAREEERGLFQGHLAAVLMMLSQRPAQEPEAEPQVLERIA